MPEIRASREPSFPLMDVWLLAITKKLERESFNLDHGSFCTAHKFTNNIVPRGTLKPPIVHSSDDS